MWLGPTKPARARLGRRSCAACGASRLASVGGALWFGGRSEGGHVVGVSNHTNFLRAVREGVLDVEATPVHRGRTQQLWQVAVTDEAGKLVARGEVRLANISAEQIGG